VAGAKLRSLLPLATLLSQVLVAYTIEFDNEFERLMPHRTTTAKPAKAPRGTPWLVSLAMYANFLRFVDDAGIPAPELLARTRLSQERFNFYRARLGRWWGYLQVGSDAIVRPTAAGSRARAIWAELFDVIEARWRTRFGAADVDRLKTALRSLVARCDRALPDYLPILGYGLFSEADVTGGVEHEVDALPLPALLSKVLLAFALDFERQSELSLAICANVLRLLDAEGAAVRALPALAGVSKEAMTMALGYLEKRGAITIETGDAEKPHKMARLTAPGRRALAAYRERLSLIEERWRAGYGEAVLRELRESLERIVGNADDSAARLFEGLSPHAGGWRASLRPLTTLPHYPMVLHRGGFPDGA